MADNNYVPQIDYTSRDYTSIRNDLISLIPFYNPTWTTRDTADFGITLIELFSYVGDILNYYVDRSANEAYITTASQRDNVLQLARLLSYLPTESTASKVTVTFQNSTASAITVPAKTQIATTTVTSSTSAQIIFETDSAVTVPAKVGNTNGSVNVLATQGITENSELLGTSDGTANQLFKLFNSSVINNSIQITINNVAYTNVQYLIDYNNNDPVFTTSTNAAGDTYVVFGDGVSGRIPPTSGSIYATYRVGGGISGNVAANTIKYVLTNAAPGLSVTNQNGATGGAHPESTDSIRINAPLSIRALNRAVSLRDYSELVLQVSGVAKAISAADVYTNVTLYVAPFGDRGVESDNVTPTSLFNTLASTIVEYLIDKAPANTTLTLQPPSYVGITLYVDITVLPQYKQSLVKTAAESYLYELFNFDNVVFADKFYLQDVMTVLSSVTGVANAQVPLMVRTDNLQQFTITNKAITSGVATLTTSSAHNITVGQTVRVASVDATFNGVYVVSAVTSNTFSYAVVATNVPSTASTGSATVLTTANIICNTNEIPELTNLVITATGGITS